MRYLVDKMPDKPADCPFSVPSLYPGDWWCMAQTMKSCPYFTTEDTSDRHCLALVSMTDIISKLNEK